MFFSCWTPAAFYLVSSPIALTPDNLAANYSRELADYIIYVIDVAGGDKVPRKGGPGITQSDLLIINKTDLAEAVGADLEVRMQDRPKAHSYRCSFGFCRKLRSYYLLCCWCYIRQEVGPRGAWVGSGDGAPLGCVSRRVEAAFMQAQCFYRV